jgi:hypothetical protein
MKLPKSIDSSLEHLEATVGLLIGLISILLCFSECDRAISQNNLDYPTSGALEYFLTISCIRYHCPLKTIALYRSHFCEWQ